MSAAVDAPDPVLKAPAEALALRAQPRPVARFRRLLIIGVTAGGLAVLSTSAWLALSPRERPKGAKEAPPALAPAGAEETLAALPKDYGQTAPPKLGPPLPGDLGRAIVHRQGAVETTQADAQAAAAERERLAAQARQAREAGVMVRMGKGDAASQTAMELSNLPIGAPPLAQALSPAFLDRPPSPTANGHVLTEPASPFQVMAGDTIAATLLTGLDSGLPGFVTAQVSQNVYDTVSGRFLLIPQGARLIGEYDSTVAFGQSRILLAWRRLILPDGSSIELDNLPATDSAGYAGLKDTVDFHGPALAKAAALSTLLGVGSQLAMEGEDATIRTLRRSAQQSASTVGEQIVGKQLSVRPTLKIRPGFPLRVIVHKDLTLRPWRAS